MDDLCLVFSLLGLFLSTGECIRNCTNSYYVSQRAVDSDGVDFTNESSNITQHVPLSDFLRTFGSSECDLKLLFSRGKYVLTSYNIKINTSLTMSALESGVAINCSNAHRENTDEINATIWINLGDTYYPTGYTTLNGITFEDCVFQLKVDYVKTLSVDNCTFRGFKSPGLDVYNCLNVVVINSKFTANNVTAFNDRFRADSAGLSVAYNFHHTPSSNPTLQIKQCEFSNNTAAVSSELSNQIDNALNNNTYPARGGGLGIIVTEDHTNVTVSVEDCVFLENYAAAFGGALYLIVAGQGSNHSLCFSNSKFILNRCKGGGGAVFLGYISTNFHGNPTKTEFNNVLFDRNAALSSGGVLVLQTQSLQNENYAVFRSCNFTGNSASGEGAALVFGSLHRVQARRLFHGSTVEDCVFTNNTSLGGILIAGFTHIQTHGTCSFVTNTGPALRITGALVEIKGNITFSGNKGDISGKAAMYFTALGQVKVYRNSFLKFTNNTGSIGAAIRIELQQFPKVYTNIVGNPLCFLQYENSTLPPKQWQEDLIDFHGNTAHLGSAIFASYFDFCSYNGENQENITKSFAVDKFKKWPIFNFGININDYHTIQTSENYYVQTPAVSIDESNLNSMKIYLRPGKKHVFNLTGLDQFDSQTYFIARILDKDNSLLNTLSATYDVSESFEPPANYSDVYRDKDIPILHFSPNLLAVNPSSSNAIQYSVESRVAGVLDKEEKVVLIEFQNTYGEIYDVLEKNIYTLPCLPGYKLQRSNADSGMMTCQCVGAHQDSFAVLNCHEEDESIHLRDGYWAGYSFTNLEDTEQRLIVHTCPITYCQCEIVDVTGLCETKYYYQDTNKQCHPPRQGPLCGLCDNDSVITVLTLTCSDNCYSSEYTLYFATAAMVIFDSILIILILMLSIWLGFSFPHALKPIIFYIQTVYITTEYFPISFWKSRKYMLFLSNLIGLYFPVDFCFLPDTPSVLSFTTRFIPIVLSAIITSLFFCFKRARRGMWHGVWALVLLLYAPLVYTCVMLLNCPMLPDEEGKNNVGRWFLDASIECFADSSHIVLGAIAIVFLVVVVLMIPGLILLILFEYSSLIQDRYSFLIYVLKELKAGYRPKLHWMSSVELIKRLVLVGILVSCPGRTILPIYVLAFFFVIHLYFLPYENHINNIFEGIILLNYIVLLLFRFCQTILDTLDSYTGVMVPSDSPQGLPYSLNVVSFFAFFFYIPVLIGLLIVAGFAVYRIWSYVSQKKLLYKQRQKRKNDEHTPDFTDLDKYYFHGNHTINSSGRVIPKTDLAIYSL